MKHLLNGVAIAAALVIAAPVWAQNPSGGNSMGMPGPNMGGPGLTPYSGGGVVPSTTPSGRMPAGGAKTSTRGATIPSTAPPPGAEAAPPTTSAMPPAHHAARHARAMHHFHKGMAQRAAAGGDTTAQLNRGELARIQTGNVSNPPAPSAPMPGK